MVYAIDTWEIDQKGWSWNVGSISQGRFVAYVHGPVTTQAIENSPQKALDAALAKVEAEIDSWVAELMGVTS